MHILLLNTCDSVEATSVTVTGSGLRIAVDSAHTAAEEKSGNACRELRANQQKNMKQQRHKHRRGRAGWFWQPRQTLKLHSVQCGCHIWMQQCSSSIFFSFRFTAKADAGSDCEGENEQRVNAESVWMRERHSFLISPLRCCYFLQCRG